MKNEGLIEMLSLEKSLVYFSTSLRANTAVLDKFPRLVKFFEEDDDLWDDVLIENRQAIEMSNIYRDILSGTMDTYASIISNNLNVVMKTLTVLTLLVDTPAMIAALWGMNTGVPFEGKLWGFWVVVGINVLICIALIIVFIKKKCSNNTDFGKSNRHKNRQSADFLLSKNSFISLKFVNRFIFFRYSIRFNCNVRRICEWCFILRFST